MKDLSFWNAACAVLLYAKVYKFWLNWLKFEPPHDKTNNMAVRPAKTQISLGIRPV